MADIQTHKAALDDLDVRVVALSSDTKDGAAGTVEKLGLEFTVLYGLDPATTSQLIGCYTGIHDGSPHIQPASFVLDGDGGLVHAVYSSGKVGRLTAADALTLATDVRKKKASDRGRAAP